MLFPLNSPTILIVDDVIADRGMYRQSLLLENPERYRILETSCLEEAILLCQHDRPDLILLNDTLADSNGLKFPEMWHQRYQASLPPVVMLTQQSKSSHDLPSFYGYQVEQCWHKAHLSPEMLPCLIQSTLERLHLKAQVLRQQEQQRLIKQIAHRIAQSLSLSEILQTTLDEVCQFLEADRLLIYQAEPDQRRTIVAESSFQSSKASQDVITGGVCAEEGEEIVIPIQVSEYFCPTETDGSNTATPWGALLVQHPGCLTWQETEIEFLNHLAFQLSLAIQQSRIYRQFQAEVTELKTNIEQHKQTELALHQGEIKYQTLISTLPDLIMQINGEGIYLEFFPTKSFKVFGSRDLIGKSIFDITLPQDLANLRMSYIQRALQTRDLQVYEQQVVVDQELRTEEVRIAVCGENEVLVIVRDVTDRKRTEEALRRSEATQRTIIGAIPDLLIRANA
ncbi:MAG: GAF domain-containing protein [Leptolyngbyaceae cyanobacterium bins.59]|nr:GAF domain-containing protein [Leptolyngbyaceae cyanobacterium bins.59]